MAGVTRSLAVAVALAAAALTAAAALAVPGNPSRAIRPVDQARARTVLLRRAELPGTGWTGKPTSWNDVQPDCVVKKFSLSKLTANAEIGVQFTRPVDKGTFLVESDVHVFETAGQATAAVATRDTLGYARCLGSTLSAEAPFGSKKTTKVETLVIKGLALPTHGFRITLVIDNGAVPTTLTAYVIGFRHGRTLTTLSVLAVDKHWSRTMLHAVAAKLAARTARV